MVEDRFGNLTEASFLTRLGCGPLLVNNASECMRWFNSEMQKKDRKKTFTPAACGLGLCPSLELELEL